MNEHNNDIKQTLELLSTLSNTNIDKPLKLSVRQRMTDITRRLGFELIKLSIKCAYENSTPPESVNNILKNNKLKIHLGRYDDETIIEVPILNLKATIIGEKDKLIKRFFGLSNDDKEFLEAMRIQLFRYRGVAEDYKYLSQKYKMQALVNSFGSIMTKIDTLVTEVNSKMDAGLSIAFRRDSLRNRVNIYTNIVDTLMLEHLRLKSKLQSNVSDKAMLDARVDNFLKKFESFEADYSEFMKKNNSETEIKENE